MNTQKHTWLRANTFRCHWFWLLFKCRIHCCCSEGGLQESRILTALKIPTVLLEWRDVSGRQTSGAAHSARVHSWILGAVFIYWYRRTKCRQSWNYNQLQVQFAWLCFCLEPLRAAFVPVFMTNTWKQKKMCCIRSVLVLSSCVCVCVSALVWKWRAAEVCAVQTKVCRGKKPRQSKRRKWH